jgi:hypothetical protein
MNIFILNEDPVLSAEDHCDKHVVKMILESGQMLCAAHEPNVAPWKRTHYNHPCTVWTRSSRQNYVWLSRLGLALCSEYTKRYKKIHKSEIVLKWCADNIPSHLPDISQTPFAIAIKDKKYHLNTPVESYRAYYLGEKIRFAKWKYSKPPEWWSTKNA